MTWRDGLKRWWQAAAAESRDPAQYLRAARNSELISIGDPRVLPLLGAGPSVAGVEVTERSAFGLSAFWRGAMLVAGSIAGLPLNTLRDVEDVRTKVTSLFDNPGAAVGMGPYTWKETQVLHLLCHGDTFLWKIFNGAGALVALQPVHPLCVSERWNPDGSGTKLYKLPMRDGRVVEVGPESVAQIMGPSMDGLRGMSAIRFGRTSLGGAIAGDRSAAKLFSDGALLSALVTTDGEPVDDDEEEAIDDYLARKAGGWENAAQLRFINRPLKVQPFSMSLEDAQYLQSRQFSIQDVGRWLGVHPSLLMDPGAVSTWGTGVEIQQRGLSRFTLPFWTDRMQDTYTGLIAGSRFVKFDFHGLERGSPADEVTLINAKIDGALMTVNEGRKALGLPGVGPDGDVLRLHGQPIGSPPSTVAEPTPPAARTSQPLDTWHVNGHRELLVGVR